MTLKSASSTSDSLPGRCSHTRCPARSVGNRRRRRADPLRWSIPVGLCATLCLASCSRPFHTQLERACGRGDMNRCNGLGNCYATGSCGMDQDERLAQVPYRKACDGGNAAGCANLAQCYDFGRCGLPEDAQQAATLYQKACDGGEARACAGVLGCQCRAGNLPSCTELGRCFDTGNCGLSVDGARARAIFQEACDAKESAACLELEKPPRCDDDDGCPDGLACLANRCRNCFQGASDVPAGGAEPTHVVRGTVESGLYVDQSPALVSVDVNIGSSPGDISWTPREVDRDRIDVYFSLTEHADTDCKLVVDYATGKREGLVTASGEPDMVGKRYTFHVETIPEKHRTLRVVSAE